jgi:hypothetical protein
MKFYFSQLAVGGGRRWAGGLPPCAWYWLEANAGRGQPWLREVYVMALIVEAATR